MDLPPPVKAITRLLPLHSLQAKFLTIVIPLVLLSTTALLAVLHINAHRATIRDLEHKLEAVAVKQSAVLMKPVRKADGIEVSLVLAAIAADPDVLGVAVYDQNDDVIERVGDFASSSSDSSVYLHSQPIEVNKDDGQHYVGRIELALSDRRVRAETRRAFLRDAGVAAVLVALMVLSVLLAHRRSVGAPMRRLIDSMHLARDSGESKPIAWQSDDEMGAVISAFNALQQRQSAQRAELKAARDEEAHFLEVANSISSELELEHVLQKIIAAATELLRAERASLFLHDGRTNELWSRVSEGAITQEIRIPATSGLAGACFNTGDVLNIPDAYADPRFNREVDRRTGQRTQNVLCIPVRNKHERTLGVLQLVNKIDGVFNDRDITRLKAFSAQFSIALENAQLYENAKALNKAKERAIDHLSHELKTPLAILSGVLKKIQRERPGINDASWEKTLERGQRSLKRLLALQDKMDDILRQNAVDKKGEILAIVESAADLLRDLGETGGSEHAQLIDMVAERLEDLYGGEPINNRTLDVSALLEQLCQHALVSMQGRKIDIIRNLEEHAYVVMDKHVFETTCSGILQNAIENTPDQGRIEVSVRKNNAEVRIKVHDYGIGITSENQKVIFGGFFHTQSTETYSSGPYQFNAGGSGADLLRIRCLAERHGFSVDFESTRCQFIPEDHDVCPGRISECTFVTNQSQCRSSGESEFSITIPIAPRERTGTNCQAETK